MLCSAPSDPPLEKLQVEQKEEEKKVEDSFQLWIKALHKVDTTWIC